MTSVLTDEAREAVTELLALCYNDPELFILEILHPEPWTDTHGRKRMLRRWQSKLCAEIKRRLLAGETSVIKALIRTCHGAGKTFMAAALVIWWTFRNEGARTLTLAPTWSGVEELLWPEIEKLYNRSLLAKLQWGRMLATKLDLGETWYAIGAASDRPQHLEGHHSKTAAMRVVDEAKAVDKGTYDSTKGMLDAPENFDLWISTPSIQDGEFFKRDTSTDDVIRIVVDVDELIDDGVPGKAAWKAECARDWGTESEDFKSRVMALYIDQAQGTLFPVSWIERAMNEEFVVTTPLVAGMDVAGSVDGDENAVAVSAGPDADDRFQVLPIEAWKERDTMVSKGRAVAIALPIGGALRIDVIGLGKGVADAAAEVKGIQVEEYRASSAPVDTVRFTNRKAEDAWSLRTRLEKRKVRLPQSQTLKAQMKAMRYEILSTGKLRVVDPSDSPDHADAAIISLSTSSLGAVFGLYVEEAERLEKERKEGRAA